MKVLLTGSNGFLGQHLTMFLLNKGFEVIATSRGDGKLSYEKPFIYESLDCTNEQATVELLHKYQPDVVIHNAAMSKPDECDAQPAICVEQNITATQNLLKASKNIAPYFIYVSTDFVFGENGPHAENDATGPLNLYGSSKLIAERLVETSGLKVAIMRPVLMYGPLLHGMKSTFVHWVYESLLAKKTIKVVSDQLRTPTYVFDVCAGLVAMIQQQFVGTIHLAGKNIISPYDMAVTIASVTNLDASYIEKVTADTFVEKVRRAKKSGLKIDMAMQQLQYLPVSFEEGIRLTFATNKNP